MKTLILIPAKGTSLRIKKKNLKKIGNKSLLQIKVENAINADCATVYVSTENKNIAILAKKYGAKVPFLRNHKYSSKTSSSISFVLDFLRSYKKEHKVNEDLNICILPVTNPFLKSETIKKCVELFNKIKNKTSLTSIVKSNIHPYQFVEISKNMINFNLFKYKGHKYSDFEQTQKWPVSYISSPAIRITNATFFLKKIKNIEPTYKSKMIDLNSCIGHEINSIEAIDINTSDDLDYAKMIYDLKIKP